LGNPGLTIFKPGISGTSIIIVGISKLDINILPGLRDDTFIFRKSGLSKYKFGISESDPLLLLPFHTVVFLKFDLPVIIFKSSVKKIYDRYETNRYAATALNARRRVTPHGRENNWKPVTRAEMMAFFGLVFAMGIAKKPSYASYWERKRNVKMSSSSVVVNLLKYSNGVIFG
jgi:hypothetical protein